MSNGGHRLDERDLREHAAFVERLALRLVGDVHLAQDVVQEAFAAAWERRDEPRRSLRGWLAAVVRNQALMLRRAAGRRRRREEAVAVRRQIAGPPERAARLELHERLVRAVRELPQPYRDVLVRRFLEGLGTAEIAARDGVTRSTVRTRVQRALELVRGRLDLEHDGDRRTWCAALLGVPPDALARSGTGAASGVRSAPATHAAWIMTGVLAVSKKWIVGVVLLLLLAVLAGSGVLHDDGTSTSAVSATAPTADEVVRDRVRRRDDSPGGARDPSGAVVGEGASDPAGPAFADVDRERDLFGVVRSADGQPVAGADVSVFAQRFDRAAVLRRAPANERIRGPRGVTGADGAFVLRLTPGNEVELHVTADGHADLVLPGCVAGERVDLVLAKAASLTVRVTNPDGLAVGAADVSVRRYVQGLAPVVRRSARTAADGQVRFDRLTPGSVYVVVGHADWGGPVVPPVEIEAGGAHSIHVALVPGRTVTGRVVDGESGDGVADAMIGEGWTLARAVRSDSEGRFHLPGFTGDRRRMLHCRAPGFARAQLVPPDEGDAVFRLTRGDVVVGRVLGPDGNAVEDALVSAVGSRHTNHGQELDSVSSLTNTAGGFRLEALRRDLPHTLIVQAPGAAKLLLDLLPRAEGAGLISLGDVRLAHGRSIAGVLLDPDGHPVRGEVEVTSLTPRPAGTYYGPAELRRTDDLGRFRFMGLAPDRYRVEALVAGRPWIVEECVLGADADVEGFRLQLPRSRTLELAVVAPDGAPLADVEIIVDSPGYVFEATTDSNGRAVVSATHDPPWTVRLWPPRAGIGGRTFLSRVIDDVDPAAGTLRVELVESAWIRGRVTDAAGRPLPRMFVRASRGDSSDDVVASVVSDGDGAFALAVPHGKGYSLIVDGSRRSAANSVLQETLPVRVVARNVTAPSGGLVLRAEPLAADRELVVRVVAPDGRPVAGARVIAAAAGGAPLPMDDAPRTFTDAAGLARLDGLTPQPVRVFVEHGRAAAEHRVLVRPALRTVVPGGDVVELAFREGAPLEGVVRDADGGLVAGAVVRTSLMSGLFLSESVTDATGRFRTRGLTGQDHQFHIRYERSGAAALERYVRGLRPGIDLELAFE